MREKELSPLEKLISKKIKKTKPKVSQPGYLKRLVANLYLTIEDALEKGCEYDDIARSISETDVKIKPITLKQYHVANRRQKKQSNQDLEALPKSEELIGQNQTTTINSSDSVLPNEQFAAQKKEEFVKRFANLSEEEEEEDLSSAFNQY
jgi:hypothetical protein